MAQLRSDVQNQCRCRFAPRSCRHIDDHASILDRDFSSFERSEQPGNPKPTNKNDRIEHGSVVPRSGSQEPSAYLRTYLPTYLTITKHTKTQRHKDKQTKTLNSFLPDGPAPVKLRVVDVFFCCMGILRIMFDTQARDWMLRGGRRAFRYEIRKQLTFRFENSMSVFYLVEEKTDRAGELFS